MSTSYQQVRSAPKAAYCYCTERSHQEILDRQQAEPLTFGEAMTIHCEAGNRCGRCLHPLEQLFRSHNCFYQ
jgi:bacterioferritin-associated ferredoxin